MQNLDNYNELKIIHITDVHEGTKDLRLLLQKTQADLYLISGDLLYYAFYSYENNDTFIQVQLMLEKFRTQDGFTSSLYDYAWSLIYAGHNDKLIKVAWQYIWLFKKAKKNMRQKYSIIEAIFQYYAKAPVYVIPGNYDMDLNKTVLRRRNLHGRSLDFYGYKISGCGGADSDSPGFPQELIVTYQDSNNPDTSTEALKFFRQQNPDIAVIHKPIYGFFDKMHGHGSMGSLGLLPWLEKIDRLGLVLSGHIHEHNGAMRRAGVVYSNPGSFGQTIRTNFEYDGGYYTEIYLPRGQTRPKGNCFVRRVKRMKIEEGILYHLATASFADNIGVLYQSRIWQREYDKWCQFFRPLQNLSLRQIIAELFCQSKKRQFEHLPLISLGIMDGHSYLAKADGGDGIQLRDFAHSRLILFQKCNQNFHCRMDTCHRLRIIQNMLWKVGHFSLEKNGIAFNPEIIECFNVENLLQTGKTSQATDIIGPSDQVMQERLQKYLIRFYIYQHISHISFRYNLRYINNLLRKRADWQNLFAPVWQKAHIFIEWLFANQNSLTLLKLRVQTANLGIYLPPAIEQAILRASLGHIRKPQFNYSG